jgi:hypothetical protein
MTNITENHTLRFLVWTWMEVSNSNLTISVLPVELELINDYYYSWKFCFGIWRNFFILGSGVLTKLNLEIDFKHFKGLILKGKLYYRV